VVWTDSWLSIAGAGCGLICVGAGEERARKVCALRGLRGVERQVGSSRGTRWPAGSSAGMVTRKARRCCDRSWCRVAAHDRSLHAGFAADHHKTSRVTWLGHKTDERLGERIWDPGAPRSFEAEDTRRDRKACIEAKRGAVAGHPSDGATMRIPKVPLRGVYPSIM
jgi:hypothetical protein